MFGRSFGKPRAGQIITARMFREPAGALERIDRMGCASPLNITRTFGIPAFRSTAPEEIDARLIAHVSTGHYTWQGVYDTPGGGTADLPANISDQSGLEYAYEKNGVTTITAGTIVTLKRGTKTGEWRFQLGQC